MSPSLVPVGTGHLGPPDRVLSCRHPTSSQRLLPESHRRLPTLCSWPSRRLRCRRSRLQPLQLFSSGLPAPWLILAAATCPGPGLGRLVRRKAECGAVSVPRARAGPSLSCLYVWCKREKGQREQMGGEPPVSRLTSRARACVQETLGLLASQL